MKLSTILIIGLIISIGLTSYSKASVLENEHYIICGHVYEPYTHDIVLIENIRTGEMLEIKLQQFEPDKKEYQVTIANFPSGWDWSDTITVTYDNEAIITELTKGDVGIQTDFNRPFDVEPMAVITGTILILSSSGLYYRIKRGKNMSENVEVKETNVVEKKDTPLGLPTGSIRALLAMFGLIGMIVFEFYGKPMSGELTTVVVALVMTFVGAHVPIIKK